MRGFRVSQLIFIGKNNDFGGTFFPFKDLHEANIDRQCMPCAVMIYYEAVKIKKKYCLHSVSDRIEKE